MSREVAVVWVCPVTDYHSCGFSSK
jgi:hypothetical protein